MKIIIYFIIYFTILFFYANYMDIGNLEIDYLEKNSFISLVENLFLNYFGNNNFILRLPSLILSIFSVFLYYKISQKYLKRENDIFLSLVIFSLMPGFIIASLLFNKSIYIMFLVLLFIYLFIYQRIYSYILLLCLSIIDYSFISLYLGLIFYSIYKKDTKFLLFAIFLFMVNANYFDYTIKGHPRGHFIDIIGIYFAIFSPFVFIYFLYSLIKMFKIPTLLWFISSWSLLFSILLSFRQKIKIDDFAPFVIVSVIFMISVFIKDYRIRLNIFRPNYKKLFIFLFFTLLLFDIFLLFSPYILNIKIVEQFKYSNQIANVLKTKQFINIKCNDSKLCKKLYFYGLKKGDEYYLYWDKNQKKVSISHNNKKIYNFYVSNLNKK